MRARSSQASSRRPEKVARAASASPAGAIAMTPRTEMPGSAATCSAAARASSGEKPDLEAPPETLTSKRTSATIPRASQRVETASARCSELIE